MNVQTLDTAICDAKQLADGASVYLANKVVTAIFNGGFYMEESSRSCAIWVASTTTVAVGNVVAVTGTLATTTNYERCVNATAVSVTSSGSPVSAVMMTNQSIGGADYSYNSTTGAGQKGVQSGTGLNNIGLLLVTTGNVTFASDTYFYIDDGTHATDFSIFNGIRVICPAGTAMPAAGHTVSLTGISSIMAVENTAYRCIKIRSGSDIQINQ